MKSKLLIMSFLAVGFLGGLIAVADNQPGGKNVPLETQVEDLRRQLARLDARLIDFERRELPVGTIAAWHKNVRIETKLPYGWVECNGKEAVVDGQKIFRRDGNVLMTPDLNSGVYVNGRGRYLRGGAASGLDNQSTLWTSTVEKIDVVNGKRFGVLGQLDHLDADKTTQSAYENKKLGKSRRFQVAAMTVVWIIRVK